MNKETKELIKQFHSIARKRWIKSISKSFGSIGLTFEKELNKTPDSMYFPDYLGIEIKCTSRYSRYPLFLFTSAFDGPTFPEINRIVEKYGYFDKDFTDKKVLFEKLNCTTKQLIKSNYKLKLDIDELNEKMYLCVYDLYDNLIERKSFLYLKTLYNHLILKLNNLAIIYASKRKIDDEIYFRYYKICIYKLTDFNRFIYLLKNGTIDISLIARISKSGNDIGRYRNKNLVFAIKKSNINTLFKEIYTYNYDNKKY